MSALNFPASPADGDTYPAAGRTWKWSDAAESWNVIGTILDLATAAEFLADTPDKLLSTDPIWAAAEPVTLPYSSGHIAVDMSTFINGTRTLTANSTLDLPTNIKSGSSGAIEVVQDGTGGRTLAFAAPGSTQWEFEVGTSFAIASAAGASTVMFYYARSSTKVFLSRSRPAHV